MQEQEFKIKAYSSKELAALYNVSYHTFLTWLNPIRAELGEQIARMWTPQQVSKMIEHLGTP